MFALTQFTCPPLTGPVVLEPLVADSVFLARGINEDVRLTSLLQEEFVVTAHVPVPQNLEGRFEESTQEFIIEQIGDQIVHLPVIQIMPEIIEVPAVTCTVLSPTVEYVAPSPADTFAAPAPETEHVTPAPERVEQIVDVPFPPIAEVAQIIPPARFLRRIVMHLVDAPVPQVVEDDPDC